VKVSYPLSPLNSSLASSHQKYPVTWCIWQLLLKILRSLIFVIYIRYFCSHVSSMSRLKEDIIFLIYKIRRKFFNLADQCRLETWELKIPQLVQLIPSTPQLPTRSLLYFGRLLRLSLYQRRRRITLF
jgi:hypothetical protein